MFFTELSAKVQAEKVVWLICAVVCFFAGWESPFLDNAFNVAARIAVSIPDLIPGCIVEEMILISLWDNSSIGVFKKNGELIEILDIPVLRPTNCKFLKNKSELWVTSAMEGLSKSHKRAYPSSGDTLVFDINIK